MTKELTKRELLEMIVELADMVVELASVNAGPTYTARALRNRCEERLDEIKRTINNTSIPV